MCKETQLPEKAQTELSVVPEVPAEIIEEELEGLDSIDLQRVRIEKDGTGFFIMGETGARVQQFEGYILYTWSLRLYFERDESGEPKLICRSPDGIKGIRTDGTPCDCGCNGICRSCALNEFGSGVGGRGKACRELRPLILRIMGYNTPMILTLPPTSLRQNAGYRRWRSFLYDTDRGTVFSNLQVKAIFTQSISESPFGKYGVVMITPEFVDTGSGRVIKLAESEEVQKNLQLRNLVKPIVDQQIARIRGGDVSVLEDVAGKPGEDFSDGNDQPPF